MLVLLPKVECIISLPTGNFHIGHSQLAIVINIKADEVMSSSCYFPKLEGILRHIFTAPEYIAF